MTYIEVKTRLVEIIYSGQQEQKAKKGMYEQIKGYYVLSKDRDEFLELLEIENTYYQLETQKNANKSNDDLLWLCNARAEINNQFREDYLRLAEILKESNSKKAYLLNEYLGYYILRTYELEFLDLCKKLEIGPCQRLELMYHEEAKTLLKTRMQQQLLQRDRIADYMLIYSKLPYEPAPLVNENMDILKLALYLSSIKELNLNTIPVFLPLIGKSNYYFLIKELYLMNVVDRQSFIKLNQEMINDNDMFLYAMEDYINLVINNSSENKR